MMHPLLAGELAKANVVERAAEAGRRRLSDGEAGRREALLAGHRRAERFERQLSALGAAALVALVVFGPVAVLALAFAAGLSAAIGPVVRDPWRRAAAISADPWQAWRSVEPDPEYLRRRAA